MEHDPWAHPLKEVANCRGIGDITVDKLSSGRHRRVEIYLPAGGQIIKHGDLHSARKESIDQVRSNKSGSAGDECAHKLQSRPSAGATSASLGNCNG